MSANISRARTVPMISATREAEMAAFDSLPAETRQLLAGARYKFSSVGVVREFKRGKDTGDIAQQLTATERRFLHDVNMLPVWGDHHPQEIPTSHAPKSLKDLDL